MAGFRWLAGTEEIEWGGRRYRRQPDHKHRHRRVYFMATTAPRSYLHRDIYEEAHGPIPDTFHVHHVDHDPLNNDVANLVAVAPSEHSRHHGAHLVGFVRLCERCGAEFVAIRRWARWCAAACKQAQRRDDGVAYVRPPKGPYTEERECERCGASFIAKRPWARFCTSACKQRAMRARRREELAA